MELLAVFLPFYPMVASPPPWVINPGTEFHGPQVAPAVWVCVDPLYTDRGPGYASVRFHYRAMHGD